MICKFCGRDTFYQEFNNDTLFAVCATCGRANIATRLNSVEELIELGYEQVQEMI